MKIISDIAFKEMPEKSKGKVVEFIAVLGGMRKLENPTLSTELSCTACAGVDHICPHIDPVLDPRRVWICLNDCVTNSGIFRRERVNTPPTLKRSILWPLFCEINGIGDIHHDVKFENIQQSDGKLAYLLKFANKPYGIILMHGMPGTGKTYASLAICEYFTRTRTSCIFTTQKQMFNDWTETFKTYGSNNYISRVRNVSLLVVDDLGLSKECSANFMSFFMDIINSRMQWTDKGTIITTNLDDKSFAEFCGDPLLDRINTGQEFIFTGSTRREKNIL